MNKNFFLTAAQAGSGALLICLPMQVAYADITGTVFRDFNANGLFDTGMTFNEVGMAGITVKAFAADDTVASPTASTVSGTNGAYALTGLTAGQPYRLEFSWNDAALKPGVAGGSTVQFIQDGMAGINVAVAKPNDYSQAQPDLVTTLAVLGPSDDVTAAGKDFRDLRALVRFSSDSQGKPGDAGYIAPTVLARHRDIGSTFGLAYQREADAVFASAFYKRASGFGPGGPGAIYRISSTGAISIHATIPNAGAGLHNFNATASYESAYYDDAVVAVGKESLGDLEISADGSSLFVVNLNDRHLYQVASNTGAVSDLGEITRPAECINDLDFRPFALAKDENDTLYVGAVCSNESQTEPSGHPSALILKYAGAGTFTPVFSFDLQFGDVYNNVSQPYWSSWLANRGTTPLFTDLLFSGNDLVMAFRNLVFDQSYSPSSNVPPLGEVLKACWNGVGWELENNAVCGGQMGALPNFNATNPRQADSGPGGGNFFQIADAYNEQGMKGGLAATPGYNYLIGTTTDPFAVASGGVMRLSLLSGVKSQQYEIYQGTPVNTYGYTTMIDGHFGKSNGLGDLELLSAPAPIEVGNRIWLDADSDGIQDAGEAGIDGLQIKLVCGADEVVTITADGGVFLFSNTPGGNAEFMGAGENCSLHVANTQVALNGYVLTAVNADGISSNDALTDLRDSDATRNGGTDDILFTVGNSGDNNHSLDMGYKSVPLTDISLAKTLDKLSAKRGEVVVYTLTVSNGSTTLATGVEVTDPLPAGVTYLGDDGVTLYGADVFDETTGLWTVGDVPAVDSKILHVTVRVN